MAEAKVRLKDGTILEYGQIAIDGKIREFYYFAPKIKFKSSEKLNLLIMLHGGGDSDPKKIAELTKAHQYSESKRMIVVYPKGSSSKGKTGLNWNDGRAESRKLPNDVKFMEQLRLKFIRQNKVDAKRVFVAGVSNGGMMTQRLYCQRPTLFRGFASVIANMADDLIGRCQKQTPANLLYMIATEDGIMPYDGGEILSGRKSGLGGTVASSEETTRQFMASNGCDIYKYSHIRMKNLDTTDGVETFKKSYKSGCKDKIIWHYTMVGANHSYPNFVDGNPAGNDFEATAEIINFMDKIFELGI